VQRFSVRGVSALRAAIVVSVGALMSMSGAQAGKADSGSQTRAIIIALQAKSNDAAVADEPVQRATAVLERANDARQEQREEQARLLEDLALEWAKTAQHLLEVSKLEAQAQDVDQKLSEAETKLRRARALLEETETRRGRARTELLRLEPDSVEELDPNGSGLPAPAGAPAPPASANPPPAEGRP
jgi:chromosome segregation ATPase